MMSSVMGAGMSRNPMLTDEAHKAVLKDKSITEEMKKKSKNQGTVLGGIDLGNNGIAASKNPFIPKTVLGG